MPRSADRPSVALLIETSNRYSRELVHGVRAWMQSHRPWTVHLTEQGRGNVPPPWLAGWKGDGIIARLENRRIETAVLKKNVPVVSVSASGLGNGLPAVITDSQAVGRLAAEHLIERGFRHFGYCGDARFPWSASHGEHFTAALREQGFTCDHFNAVRDDHRDRRLEQRKLAAWLRRLPKPAGVMACYDIRAQQLLDVCRQAGLHVPDQVGVVGQHDDALLCELCDPPLTSVIPDPRQAGYQAAALLDRMMRRQPVAARLYPVAPLGVAVRGSTDFVATGDPGLAAAMRFIRANAHTGINVDDVRRHVGLSRTLLERKFRAGLGSSPYAAIQDIRHRAAEQLLLTSDLPIATVAERTGYHTAEYFSATFKKRTGQSPTTFRTQTTRQR